jgi:hypothetical protein
MKQKRYTSQLGTGLGMIEETNALLNVWTPGMSSTQLFDEALNSGSFPGISARRLRNLISGCFAPRLLVRDGNPAEYLKNLRPNLSSREVEQLLFVYTCRANQILEDFVHEVYWPAYAAGNESISNSDAQIFVTKAVQEGLTTTPWSEKTIKNVAGYLTGTCADFGMLERGQKVNRKIIPFRTEPNVAIVLAYDLHFSGLGDNSVVAHSDWALLGMDRSDVVTELRRLSLKGVFLVQTAGEVIRIGWQCKNPEELSRAISQG